MGLGIFCHKRQAARLKTRLVHDWILLGFLTAHCRPAPPTADFYAPQEGTARAIGINPQPAHNRCRDEDKNIGVRGSYGRSSERN